MGHSATAPAAPSASPKPESRGDADVEESEDGGDITTDRRSERQRTSKREARNSTATSARNSTIGKSAPRGSKTTVMSRTRKTVRLGSQVLEGEEAATNRKASRM